MSGLENFGKILINALTGKVKCYFTSPVTRLIRSWHFIVSSSY